MSSLIWYLKTAKQISAVRDTIPIQTLSGTAAFKKCSNSDVVKAVTHRQDNMYWSNILKKSQWQLRLKFHCHIYWSSWQAIMRLSITNLPKRINISTWEPDLDFMSWVSNTKIRCCALNSSVVEYCTIWACSGRPQGHPVEPWRCHLTGYGY